jgi:WD40 repeat protein
MRRAGWWSIVAVVACVGLGGVAEARAPHRPHQPHRPRQPRQPGTPGTNQVDPARPTNVHFGAQGTIALPGRGLALAWSPDGSRIAAGGRFREKATGLRYDTRIANVAPRTLEKSFACHYFFVVSTAWSDNPFLGEVLADGGGDHAVKLWDPAGAGSLKCNPGQFVAAEGARETLGEINGWTTDLAFSPDGRFLAGASRDRMIRIWSLAPGPRQFQVVAVIYDRAAGNFASVAWRADGRGLVTGDRKGRVVAWALDPDVDLWDDATVTAFANVSFEDAPGWCGDNPDLVTHPVAWTDLRRGWVWTLRTSPDGSRVAAVGADGAAVVYAIDSGAVRYRASAPSGRGLHALAWSPDGSLLATGGDDRLVTLFGAATGEVYDQLEGHDDVVSAVAWSPDGTLLASTAGGPRISLTLLNTTTGPDQSIRLWARR